MAKGMIGRSLVLQTIRLAAKLFVSAIGKSLVSKGPKDLPVRCHFRKRATAMSIGICQLPVCLLEVAPAPKGAENQTPIALVKSRMITNQLNQPKHLVIAIIALQYYARDVATTLTAFAKSLVAQYQKVSISNNVYKLNSKEKKSWQSLEPGREAQTLPLCCAAPTDFLNWFTSGVCTGYLALTEPEDLGSIPALSKCPYV